MKLLDFKDSFSMFLNSIYQMAKIKHKRFIENERQTLNRWFETGKHNNNQKIPFHKNDLNQKYSYIFIAERNTHHNIGCRSPHYHIGRVYACPCLWFD